MAWRYYSDDNKVEVVVEPDFRGDLSVLASSHPIWIVDTPLNRPRIDAVWAAGAEANLYQVSRCADQGAGRFENLVEILGCLDDHHPHHDIVVHGISPTELGGALDKEGFRITGTTPDGFVAVQMPELRDRLIGRK
jgi:hypothetical protein